MIFWINVPLSLGALALLLPKMGKIPVFHRRRKVDWLGGVLLMASAVVFMLVLTWGGNRYLWLSPVIMAMIGASVALAFAFVWHARNADEPFLPLPLLGGTVVPYAMAAGGCALGAIVGLTVHLPLYYEVVYHLSASEAGLALIPLAAISTCGAAIAGRTMARARHYKRVAIVGTAVPRSAELRWRSRRCRYGACWCCCRCSRSGSARCFRSAWSRCRIRWRGRRSAPPPAR